MLKNTHTHTKLYYLLQPCNTERCGQTHTNESIPVHKTDIKIISLSYGMVHFHFSVVYIHQLASHDDILCWELRNFLKLAVCNTMWCGQIQNRIIYTRYKTYRKIFNLSGGTICIIFSALRLFLMQVTRKGCRVCNFWGWVWNVMMPLRGYASWCSVFKLKAKSKHKDM